MNIHKLIRTKMKIFKPFLLFLTIFTIFTIFNSCSKKDSKPDCEVNKYGTITISNSSSNPYDIYIDGVYSTRLSGRAISTKIKINEGNTRVLYAIQVSGYILYPTEKTTIFNVLSCSDYSWQIP